MAAKGSGAWAGWVLFAGTLLLVTGLINVFQGIVALVDDERLALTPSRLVIVDVTGLGWTLLIAGLLMIGAGAGLLVAQTWARIVSIILVSLHLIIQIAWLGAYPVWSLLMITLDTVILFALTARWSDAQENLGLDEVPMSAPKAAGHRATSAN
ncbi:DUF7144 family membrane protein [Kribbella sp. NBC_00359]|uniref:DUF7144 family membrane protein n=1 Tax=Kribbella sp. NBC_00359 TaxID=2975966 RepID=UPI002E1C24F5